jgi:GNAT superfamily N-acetyltransferase
MHRGDGIEVRGARSDELPSISALLADRGDPADALDLRLVADDPDEGLDAVIVAVDDGRVVCTATLLRETVVVDGVALPAGQVELVATDPSYEGRGLVRSLMDHAHERSRARGDVVQVMIGIPYFYRQFGYVYSVRIPDARAVHVVPTADPSVTVRVASADDIPAMAHLQAEQQRPVTVSMPHSPGCWRWLAAREGSQQWVAERAGEIVATARVTPPEEGLVVGEVAGERLGVESLVAAACSIGGDDVQVMDRMGTPVHEVLDPLLEPMEMPDAQGHWYYARIDRPAPVLELLRPVLGRRWRDAGGGDAEVLISSFRSHVRFRLTSEGMGEVTFGGPLQAPVSAGGSGIPPDVIAPLLFGPYGALGLEARHPDVLLGRQRDVMAVLFPPVTADLLTYYLPV